MRNGPYILVIAPEGYPGKRYRGRYAYEHHAVYWLHHGLVPMPGQVVHHKNHDKHDNRIDNLELLDGAAHRKHHSRPTKMKHIKCGWCGHKFTVSARVARARLKLRNKLFCTSYCGAMNQHHGAV